MHERHIHNRVATLAIYHEDLDADEISRRVGLPATEVVPKGFELPGMPPMPHTCWSHSIRGWPADHALGKLLAGIEASEDDWKELVATGTVRIQLALETVGEHDRETLSSEIVLAIATRGVVLDIEVRPLDDVEAARSRATPEE